MEPTTTSPNIILGVCNQITNNLTSNLQYQKSSTSRSSATQNNERLQDDTSSSKSPILFNPVRKHKSHLQSLVCHHQETKLPLIEKIKIKRGHSSSLINNLISKLFNLIIVNTVLSHLNQLNYITKTSILDNNNSNNLNNFHLDTWKFTLPNIISARAIECNLDGDCVGKDKICHENKCICARDRPIEDQDRCLPLALINEECTLPEQCLGNSQCAGGTCSCGNDTISLYNPSSKIYYCHPKRQLNEECNYDSQCPSNSYCSTNKYGCLCQNGFAASNILNQYNGVETSECLPKKCSQTSSCEEYHECIDNICKCLATHFDPTTAKCYKFGSTGGKPLNELLDSGNGSTTSTSKTKSAHDDNNIYSILKDLTQNSDNLWLVLTILIILSILILLLIVLLIRKYSLGYCWTAHKKEYEPNNKSQPKNGYFNKNSINNKSFRQKNGELDEENGDDLAEDRSNLVRPNKKTGDVAEVKRGKGNVLPTTTTTAKTGERNNYIKINISDKETNKSPYQHQIGTPLKTSTSTPV